MAAKKRAPRPCVHVETLMVAYMAGLAIGPGAGDHTAVMWCVDCGTLLHKRYALGGELDEVVRQPRGR